MDPELERRQALLMTKTGAAIYFGPLAIEVMPSETLNKLADSGLAVFVGRRIEDMAVPDTLVRMCAMSFVHNVPTADGHVPSRTEFGAWAARLVRGVALKPDHVPGLRPEQIPSPDVQFSPVGETSQALLVVTWRFVMSTHCMRVARAIEANFSNNDGVW